MPGSAREQGSTVFPLPRQVAAVGPVGRKNGDTSARVLRRHVDVATAGRDHRRARSALRMVALLKKHKLPKVQIHFEHAGVPYYFRAFFTNTVSPVSAYLTDPAVGTYPFGHRPYRRLRLLAGTGSPRHSVILRAVDESATEPPGPAVSLSALLHPLLAYLYTCAVQVKSDLFDYVRKTDKDSEEVLCLLSLCE